MDHLHSLPLPELSPNCAELQWIKIERKSQKPLYIGSFYRSPNSNHEVLGALDESLSQLTQHPSLPNIFLTGDFNLPDIMWNKWKPRSSKSYPTDLSQKLLDISHSHFLQQVVKEPAIEANMIPGISDHDAVIAKLEMSAHINRKSPRKVFLYKKPNRDNIKNDLLAFKQMFLSSNPICTSISN